MASSIIDSFPKICKFPIAVVSIILHHYKILVFSTFGLIVLPFAIYLFLTNSMIILVLIERLLEDTVRRLEYEISGRAHLESRQSRRVRFFGRSSLHSLLAANEKKDARKYHLRLTDLPNEVLSIIFASCPQSTLHCRTSSASNDFSVFNLGQRWLEIFRSLWRHA